MSQTEPNSEGSSRELLTKKGFILAITRWLDLLSRVSEVGASLVNKSPASDIIPTDWMTATKSAYRNLRRWCDLNTGWPTVNMVPFVGLQPLLSYLRLASVAKLGDPNYSFLGLALAWWICHHRIVWLLAQALVWVLFTYIIHLCWPQLESFPCFILDIVEAQHDCLRRNMLVSSCLGQLLSAWPSWTLLS